jgi:hypothetical protein
MTQQQLDTCAWELTIPEFERNPPFSSFFKNVMKIKLLVVQNDFRHPENQ